MAYISFRNVTSTSFEAKVYDLETYGSTGHYVLWYLDGNRWDSEGLEDDDTTSSWMLFDGLDPDTEYQVKVENIINGGVAGETEIDYCTTAAEDEDEVTEWFIQDTGDFGYISSEESDSYYLSEFGVVRIKVGFENSGVATFYSSGASSSRGYLSESTSFDTSSGKPDDYLEYDSNTSGDFEFTCEVEAGTYYYLFVRHRYEDESGYIDVYITPPGGSSSSGDWVIAYENGYPNVGSTMELEYELLEGEVARIMVRFTESGTAEFYSEGDGDTVGYLSDQDSDYFDTSSGEPNSILASNDYGGTGNNFSITYEVEAGTYYYLYVRHYNVTASGTPTVFIIPPESSVTIDGAYIEFGSNTGTTITVSVKGLDTSYGRNDRYIYWSIDGVEKSPVSLSSGVSQSDSYTFTGLSPSTSYTIGARITYTSGGTTYEKYLETVSCSTANWASEQQSGLGTISSTKTTNWTLRKATIFYASVKFSQSGSVTISSSGSYDTYGYLTTGTPAFDNSTGIPSNFVAENDDFNNNQNFSITHTVEAGVTYYIWVRGYSNTTSVGYITLNIIYSNRPATFQWADGKTTKASGQTFDITAGEWCDLLDNINAVRKYKGYSEFPKGSYTETYYYNYFTYPTSGQPFRYQHYNQALNAITGMLGDGYDDNAVKQKDPVTAAKINLLVSWLNGIT